MGMLSKPAFGPRVALIYVTAGSLLDVWTAVWYFYQVRGNPTVSNNAYFWLTGLFLTGLTLIFLGLILGPLGQYARKAELPPPGAEHREQAIQQTAAATPNPMMPNYPPGMVPGYPQAAQVPPVPQVANVPYTSLPMRTA
jgi:hypothetical protein